jgi:hypothetical protein
VNFIDEIETDLRRLIEDDFGPLADEPLTDRQVLDLAALSSTLDFSPAASSESLLAIVARRADYPDWPPEAPKSQIDEVAFRYASNGQVMEADRVCQLSNAVH